MLRPIYSAFAVLLIASSPADAQDYKLDALAIDHPWARVTIASRPAAGYMTVINNGDEPDRILSAVSPMAKRVELHTNTMKNGVMRMGPAGKIEIPAKGQVEFAPGGLHLMFMGLKEAPQPGQNLPVTVVFERSGSIDLEFRVEGPHEAKPASAMDHSGHDSAKP